MQGLDLLGCIDHDADALVRGLIARGRAKRAAVGSQPREREGGRVARGVRDEHGGGL